MTLVRQDYPQEAPSVRPQVPVGANVGEARVGRAAASVCWADAPRQAWGRVPDRHGPVHHRSCLAGAGRRGSFNCISRP